MDTGRQMGVNLTVYVVLLIDSDFDLSCGGVLTSQEEAKTQGHLIMDYDDSIEYFVIQPEELLDKAEI